MLLIAVICITVAAVIQFWRDQLDADSIGFSKSPLRADINGADAGTNARHGAEGDGHSAHPQRPSGR
jgi:hypothetical protein